MEKDQDLNEAREADAQRYENEVLERIEKSPLAKFQNMARPKEESTSCLN